MPYKDPTSPAAKASAAERHKRWRANGGKAKQQAYAQTHPRREYRAEHYRRHKPRKQAVVRQRLYGVTPADMQAMFEQQAGLCTLCRKGLDLASPNTVIDHDHDTGEVRGLLCRKCNMIVGVEENSPGFFERALAYLRGEA